MKTVRRLLLCLLPAILVASCSPRGMTLAAVGYHLPEEVPPNDRKFATYTLFLASAATEGSPDPERLKERFETFAGSIGEENVAIWVGEPSVPGFSLSKGQELIRRYKIAFDATLESFRGPFVIIAPLHPKEWPTRLVDRSSTGLPTAISLKGRTSEGIKKVLECLRKCVSSPAPDPTLGTRVFRCTPCGIVIHIEPMEEDGTG